MFLGEYEHSLDDKGRLAIPARFREELGEKVFITRGFDRCLMGFTQVRWEKLAEDLDRLTLAQSDARNLRRFLFANAAEGEFDRQGRVIIPQNLREHAGLEEQVVLAGMNTYFEIWSRGRWDDVINALNENGGALAEQLAALGL
jgi:MraZ protein